MLTWRDAVAALSVDALPARIVNRSRVANVERNGELCVASLFEAERQHATWTFDPSRLENTKARIIRFLGVYDE